jgi:hypothetical protein
VEIELIVALAWRPGTGRGVIAIETQVRSARGGDGLRGRAGPVPSFVNCFQH